ncbi:MAG: DNA polymerase III subunit gamma/tau [Treponema sp.]|nr:DNA polymerase III subunit gamma/tau [Treponema sp.]
MAISGYEVTASKYRPKTFDELAGQEFVVSTIKNSLKNGQIAHAYLFAGPRGCGKTSAARILARSLNCEKGHDSGPCGGGDGFCDNCRAISKGVSMDVLEIDGASNNSVNDVRQIKDEVLFPPHAGRYKVYIIDEVHMLSASAFNALLKTIEEPPPYIVFIFATTELHKVPATIKSRCQQFNFRLIPVETIQGILKKICAENQIKAEDDALFWIARESTGSMRDAFTLFDQVVSFSAGNIRSSMIREKLGIIGLEKLNALAEACAANDAPSSFSLIDEILSGGVAIEQFVIDLAGYYRSLLLIKNGVTRESLLGYRQQLFSGKALEAFDGIRLEQALDILLNCYRDIRYSISPRFDLETAVSKLTWLSKWVSPYELKESLDSARNVLLSGKSAGVFSASVQEKTESAYGQTAAPRGDDSGQDAFADNALKSGGAAKAADTVKKSGGPLASEFLRMVAEKENGIINDDDEAPMWDSSVTRNKTADAVAAGKNNIPPEVENVLSFIPGTPVP